MRPAQNILNMKRDHRSTIVINCSGTYCGSRIRKKFPGKTFVLKLNQCFGSRSWFRIALASDPDPHGDPNSGSR